MYVQDDWLRNPAIWYFHIVCIAMISVGCFLRRRFPRFPSLFWSFAFLLYFLRVKTNDTKREVSTKIVEKHERRKHKTKQHKIQQDQHNSNNKKRTHTEARNQNENKPTHTHSNIIVIHRTSLLEIFSFR